MSAAKSTPVPSNALSLIGLSTPDFSVNAAVGKEDILAIAVSAFEQEQENIINDAKAGVKDNEARQANAHERLSKAVLKVVENDAKPLRKLTKPFEALGLTPLVTLTSGSVQIAADKSQIVQYTFKIGSDPESNDSKNGLSGSFSQIRKVPISEEAVAIQQELTDLARDLQQLIEKGAGAKAQLLRLPQIERQARAKIATTMLNSSEQGRALLEQFIG